MKKRITLVQTVANLEEFYQMLENKHLPIVVDVTTEEFKKIKEESEKENLTSLFPIYTTMYYGMNKSHYYLHMNARYLSELIETNKIYIHDFIDLNGNKKYVDYIEKSYSVDSDDRLVFRDKPRLFSYLQREYNLKKNKVSITPIQFNMGSKSGVVSGFLCTSSENSEEMFSLCVQATRDYEDKQLAKSL